MHPKDKKYKVVQCPKCKSWQITEAGVNGRFSCRMSNCSAVYLVRKNANWNIKIAYSSDYVFEAKEVLDAIRASESQNNGLSFKKGSDI